MTDIENISYQVSNQMTDIRQKNNIPDMRKP